MVGVFGMVGKLEVDRKLHGEFLEAINSITPSKISEKEIVYLFISFDIVNSTQFKEMNYLGWAKVLLELFEQLRKRLQEGLKDNSSTPELWRVFGDEAVFIMPVTSNRMLCSSIDTTYKILNTFIQDLKSGTLFGNNFDKEQIERIKRQDLLSMKATAWIALVSDESVGDKAENIIKTYKPDERRSIVEFLGNDIDTGFRISKYTIDSRLVISFELAYLLAKSTKYLKNLNIVTYKKLKGIWNNRYYPVIWYHNKEQEIKRRKLEETFPFDAMEVEPLIKEYYDNRNPNKKEIFVNSEMFTDVSGALDKILEDRKLASKIENIEKVLENSKNAGDKRIFATTLELHCATICYDPETKQVLIAKRAREKKYMPGIWEFGCAKAKNNEKIAKSIEKEYKEDFGISIKLVNDRSRTEEIPIPIALYELKKNNRKEIEKGIIFLATIKGEFDPKEFHPTTKHSELKWISEEEIDSFNEPTVSDFKQSLHRAFDLINNLEKEDEEKK